MTMPRPSAQSLTIPPAWRTGNREFDQALVRLAGYHRCTTLGTTPVIVIGEKPTLRLSADWANYINTLTTVLIIGHRNNWIRLHVNRQGRAAYLAYDPAGKD